MGENPSLVSFSQNHLHFRFKSVRLQRPGAWRFSVTRNSDSLNSSEYNKKKKIKPSGAKAHLFGTGASPAFLSARVELLDRV